MFSVGPVLELNLCDSALHSAHLEKFVDTKMFYASMEQDIHVYIDSDTKVSIKFKNDNSNIYVSSPPL